MANSNNEEALFATMLCTRLCHDIAGPVSAVNNGVEFLSETEGSIPEEISDLLKLSAKESLAKLRFFRIAYGRAEKSLQSSVSEVQGIISDFFANSRISFAWPDSAKQNKIDNEKARLLASMIITVSGMLAFGGNIKVVWKEPGELKVLGSNERIKSDPEIEQILKNEYKGDLTPHNVVAMLLVQLASVNGSNLSFSASENEIVLSIFG